MALLQKAYLGATPLFRNTAWFQDDSPTRGSASSAVTVTASASAHTKGSWSPIIASTSTDVDYMIVSVRGVGVGGSASGTLLDIGKGAAGSETSIAENVAVGSNGGASTTNNVSFGIAANIPSGTRIAARIQSVVTGGKTAVVEIYTFNFGGASLVPSTVDVLGTDTATSRGTAIAANNTWTPITASTSQAYIGLAFVPSASNSVMATLAGVFEVGVGSSGNEQTVGFFDYDSTTSEFILNRAPNDSAFWIFGRDIPAGSRLAIRQDQNTTTLDGCIIGIPKP